jgi:hypothetical protein
VTVNGGTMTNAGIIGGLVGSGNAT